MWFRGPGLRWRASFLSLAVTAVLAGWPASAFGEADVEEAARPAVGERLVSEADGEGSAQAPTSIEPEPINGAPKIPAEPRDAPIILPRPGLIESNAAQPLAIKAEPAEFNGVRPGESTADELKQVWGAPRHVAEENGRQRFEYALEPFERLDAVVVDGAVASIVIHLGQAYSSEAVAEQLNLLDVEAAIVTGDDGEWLGQAYPERGVLFIFAEASQEKQVAQVILEPIDAQAFILRAETRLGGDDRAVLGDLDFALGLDPQAARAHWLKARQLASLGQHDDAFAAAARAAELEPENVEYQLQVAKLARMSGDHALALDVAKRVAASTDDRPALKARALLELGDIVALGPDRDYNRAIEFHMQAIKIAEPLVADESIVVRRRVKEILVEAHLAAAQDIAWGYWRRRDEVVPRWLDRARAIAEDLITQDGGRAEYRLLAARQSLAAYVGLEGAVDPTPAVETVLTLGRQGIDAARHPLRKQQLEWEMGLALYDALQVVHQRQQAAKALEYGGTAVTLMEQAGDRQPLAGDRYVMGRLYFRIGSIYAIEQGEHERAIPWFDKAAPLLESPIPKSALADIGRQGETLVSMAVSYWAVHNHHEAMRLTGLGVGLIEQAVEEELLDETALSVPYGNLAMMHRHLGDVQQAQAFVEKANAGRRK